MITAVTITKRPTTPPTTPPIIAPVCDDGDDEGGVSSGLVEFDGPPPEFPMLSVEKFSTSITAESAESVKVGFRGLSIR